MAHITVTAPDISCEHCKMSIERDLTAEPGVQQTDVNVETKSVRIVYDEAATSPAQLQAKLADIGYPVA